MALPAHAVASGDAPSAASAASPSSATPGTANLTAQFVAKDEGIAWIHGDVDAAFAQAKAQHRPLFLYWGAVWCPPCNQVKATLFNRRDFIARSRFFVPVYLDGDKPDAQRLGARFKVGGYPTMILFTPEGREITRLPGEVDADQYMRVLTLAMNGARPVKDILAAALSPEHSTARATLTAADWRMLAYYSWITDEGELVPESRTAATLARLALACPTDEADTAARLQLQALAAAATAKGVKPGDDPTATRKLLATLGDAKLVRANFDILTNYAGDIPVLVTPANSAARDKLIAAWDAALVSLAEDRGLSTADRLAVISARVDLARLKLGKDARLPEPLTALVRMQVAQADHETVDPYARQAVISGAAELLTEAGLSDESNALLTAELKRSHAPYYIMLGLAENAKRRNDITGALAWREKAYTAAEGPATRLQWGVGYVGALIDLTPADSARIEGMAARVIGELQPEPDSFYDRNRHSLERLGKKLKAWNRSRQHDATLQRLHVQMNGICAKLPAQDPSRTTCRSILSG